MNSIGTAKTLPPEQGGNTDELRPGTTLGQYKIIRLLGRGGMGEVYLAEHAILTTRHAVKLLPAERSGDVGFLSRFHDEARVMATLTHSGIVHVIHADESAGRHYLVMDFVGADDGDEPLDLEEALAEAPDGRLAPETVARLGKQICEAVEAAHANGVVHRDLKPANVLLTSRDLDRAQVRVTDFGLARLLGEDWLRSRVDTSIRNSLSLVGNARTVDRPRAERSSTGAILGTYEYMSPEQRAGIEADARSDIFSFGVMLYRMITGKRLVGRAKAASRVVEGLDEGWDELIDCCLEETPSERPSGMDRVAQSLKNLHAAEVARHEQESHDRVAEEQAQREREALEMARKAAEEREKRERSEAERKARQEVETRREREAAEQRAAEQQKAEKVQTETAAKQAPAKPKRRRGGPWLAFIALLLAGVAGYYVWNQGWRPKKARIGNVGHRVSPPTASRGNAGPVVGKSWTSPSTGMEFVWIEKLGMWVGKYEVTNGEYRKKDRDHSSKEYKGHSLNGDRQPVVYVNFDVDAKAYAAWLTERDRAAGRLPTEYHYRLPSEQEWLTFAQCGRGWEYPWGDNWPPRSGQAGNYDDETVFDSGRVDGGYRDGHAVTCDVAKSWANPWGLYGVGGNVWEACAKDSVGGSFGAWRGGSWNYRNRDILRCSYRLSRGGSYRDYVGGFRLVLSRP